MDSVLKHVQASQAHKWADPYPSNHGSSATDVGHCAGGGAAAPTSIAIVAIDWAGRAPAAARIHLAHGQSCSQQRQSQNTHDPQLPVTVSTINYTPRFAAAVYSSC